MNIVPSGFTAGIYNVDIQSYLHKCFQIVGNNINYEII